jgi:myosin heavy subunit
MSIIASVTNVTTAAPSPSSYINVESIGNVEDLTKLVYINETKLINELSARYKQNKIYVRDILYFHLFFLIIINIWLLSLLIKKLFIQWVFE